MSPRSGRLGAGVATLVLLALAPAEGAAGTLPLPKPVGTIPIPEHTFDNRPERLRHSVVPGNVDDTERVEVLVAPDGRPAAVSLSQTFDLHDVGAFVIWERSSALDVEALDDTVIPVLKREAAIWQGFVDGRKTLRARLTLDPAIEAELLPVGVSIAWRGAGAIRPAGALPGPGEVTVRLANRTERPAALPTGAVAAMDLVTPLDALLSYAKAHHPVAPPMAGRGLPLTLPASVVGPAKDTSTVAPFRVTGTIRVSGGTPVTDTSTAVTRLSDGLRLDGVLAGTGEFTVRATAASTLTVDLTMYPTLDARLLTPPRGRTWAEWLALGPTPNETADALTALVDGMAAAARDDEYVPYLGHHGPGRVSTTFHVAMAPPEVVKVGPKPLRPKPFGVALASVALLAILVNAAVLHRRL